MVSNVATLPSTLIANYNTDRNGFASISRLALTNPQTGRPYKEGEIITMPKLASTFQKIASDPNAMYSGALVDDIVADIQEAGKI